jgi:hypothetical protein
MNNTTDLQDQSAAPVRKVGRRSLLSTAAVTAAGIAATGLLKPSVSFGVTPALTFADIPGTGDIKVLNFALALEDLEADLYTQANQRFSGGGKNALGTYIPGLNLSDGNPDVAYTYEFSVVEARHRDFLRGALGSAAITPYKYNFGMQNLSRQQVLNLLYTAEALGTAAYLGAIPYLTTKTYLQIAGSIQGTEARHTATLAAIADQLYNQGLATAPLTSNFGGTNNGIEVPIPPDTVLKTVSPYIVT